MSRATIEILLATAATSIEVAFTLPGGTGVVPDGGAQFAVLQKQSAADGDFGWTNTPRVQALQLDLAIQPATLAEGESRWNPTVRTVETNLGGPGGGVTLQHGFETFIRAANFTGVTIPNGKVVAFAGADIPNEVPKCAPMLADGSVPPLYVIGLTSEDIPDAGTIGRVTTFGEVHDLDTSGTPYGETWVEGDILYASPTIPGGLTRIEPPPPAVAVIIAAVVKAHPTAGTLLVRPALFPRLQYGVFSDTTVQTQTAINTPKAVTFDTTEIASGISRDPLNPSRIVVERSGLYDFQFSLQVAKTTSSTGNIYIWPRVNGVDVPRSNSHESIAGSSVTAVPAWNFTLPLAAGSYFELMWAVDSTTINLDSDPAPSFGPSIPSAILAVAKINQ